MCPDEQPIVHAMMLPTFWHRALDSLIASQQSCQRLFRLLFFPFIVAITSLVIITASTSSISNTNTISAIISTSTAGITYRILKNANYALPCFATGISARQAGPILGSLGRDGVSFGLDGV